MSYIKDSLAADETVLHHGKISHWNFLAVYLLLFALSPFMWPICLALLGLLWLEMWTTEMVITNVRVIKKTGWISRKTSEIRLSKVESVSLDQGIYARICGFGTVTVTGTGINSIQLKAIKNPLAMRKAIEFYSPGLRA